MKTIEERVKIVTKEETSTEFTKEYLELLTRSMYELKSRVSKTIFFLILSVALFEFLVQSIVAEITVGPIKFNDLKVIHKITPIIIAYFYYTLLSQSAFMGLLHKVYQSVIKHHFSGIYNANLECFAWPASNFLIEDVVSKYTSGISAKIVVFFKIFLGLFFMAGTIMFEIYAYIKCFLLFGLNDILLWFALAISAMLFTQAHLIYLQSWKIKKGG